MKTKELLLPLMLACGGAHAGMLPFLGSAQQFAVLGAESVTNTGTTTLHGAVGTAPGASITGKESIAFASGGAIHQDDASAIEAQSAVHSAYDRLAAMTGGIDLSGQDLGSLGIVTAGIYRFSTSAALNGVMTIDFANDPDGVIIFQIGSSLSTAANSLVHVINGTSTNGIYFQVGSSATLGADSVFAGNILAGQSVSFGSASALACGRALALGAAVTLVGNTVSNDCNAYSPRAPDSDFGSIGYSGFGLAAAAPDEVPEPATLALFGLGLCALGGLRRSGRHH